MDIKKNLFPKLSHEEMEKQSPKQVSDQNLKSTKKMLSTNVFSLY